MGVLIRGIIGPMVNTTGAVIGKIVNGQCVLTGLREDTPGPATKDQAEQRYKFKLLEGFLVNLDGLVAFGFKKKRKHQTSLNAAFHYNYDKAFHIIPSIVGAVELSLKERVKLNLPALLYSYGPVNGPNCGTAVRNNDQTCTFSWLAYPQSKNNLHTDKAGYVIWNATTGTAEFETDIAPRSALSFNVEISPKAMNEELHFYMHFYNSDTKAVSHSVYLGSTL